MQTRPLLLGCLFVVSAFVLDCGESAAPMAAAHPDGPQFNFTNGPNTPNVFRFEGSQFIGLTDPESNLLLTAGLPTDASEVFFCGGPSGFDIMSFQHAGQLQEAFNNLIHGDDVHLHVWHLTPDPDLCADPPIAQGTGTFRFRDNDAPNVGPGANSFGVSIHGTLDDLVNGGKVRVSGAFHFLFLPDGSFRVLGETVRLHPIGQK